MNAKRLFIPKAIAQQTLTRMKTFCLTLLLSLTAYQARCQYFTATFENSGNDLIFKIKPTGGDISSPITLFEFDIRYPSSYSLTFSNLESNTGMFPNLNIQQVSFASGGYIYQKFFHNSGTIPDATYTSGLEYTVFQVTITGSGAGIFQLITNYSSVPPAEYQYSVNNGSGNPLIDQVGTNYFYSNQVNAAPDYYLEISNFPLPVSLLSFDASAEKYHIHLRWISENETGLSGYEVQRSMDGVYFTALDWLPANGADAPETYDYDDLAVEKGVAYYYRLKMLDENGDYDYSSVRSTSIKGPDGVFSLHPNPAKAVVFGEINATTEGVAAVQLFSMNGAWIKTWNLPVVEGEQVLTLDLEGIRPGLYVVKTWLDGHVRVEKISITE
jgi:hypothetical protein